MSKLTRPQFYPYSALADKKELPGHTKICAMFSAKQAFARFVYEQAHPNYCRNCGGIGELVYCDDPSPVGISLSPGQMEFSDPCPECTEKGICPECGGQWDTLDLECENSCVNCGFRYGKTFGIPPEWECFCYEYFTDEFYNFWS